MQFCSTWPDETNTQVEIQPVACPFCGITPRVEFRMYGHQMGTIIMVDGKQTDPLAGMCFSTTFWCKRECPGNFLSIQDVVLNSCPRSRESVKSLAIEKYNSRCAT